MLKEKSKMDYVRENMKLKAQLDRIEKVYREGSLDDLGEVLDEVFIENEGENEV